MAAEISVVKKIEEMKVAIVCDWLTGIGGAERVVLELHKMFPGAPIYTSQYNPNKIGWFNGADVRTGWLQKLPTSLKKFLPVLRAFYFSNLNLSQYDLVISSSGAEAKGIKTGKNTTHISYIHSPTHYYWSRYEEYLKNPGFGRFDWLARLGLRTLIGPMRIWDKKASARPDFLIANSTHTKNMIKKYYGRESEVIFPPVDLEDFKLSNARKREGFVVTGRQTPYKRIDLAVSAFTDLNKELTVIGDGPKHDELVSSAGSSVKFIDRANNKELVEKYQKSKAFIFPTDTEDFGIAPVEAMATGTPVISYNRGGPLDYIIDGINGVFFSELTKESLIGAVNKFNDIEFDAQKVSQSVSKFSTKAFNDSMKMYIKKVIE